jgi:uncharacterized protein YndB with AHSA1/START domain
MVAVTSSGPAKVTTPTDEQILVTREFDAPRHLVYRAWTTPELVRRWWAGRRGEVTLIEMDLRVGGTWRYVLVAEGGMEVAFHGEYHEIVPNERIVWTEIYEGLPDAPEDHAAVNTLTFTEVDGRTTINLLTELKSREDRDAILASGMEVGMQEQMEIIEEIATSLR